RLISQVRAVRAEMNVPPKAKIPLILKDAGDMAQARMGRHQGLIQRLARLSSLEELDGEVPKGAIQDVLDEATIILPIAAVIDLDSEKARLEKEIAKMNAEVERFKEKLANEKFIANAPQAVVETEREKLKDAINQRAKIDEALGRLTAAS
ncbi:MAG TPA: valine--tRNA ligase, partial [Rhodospirillales bacterium]|nr:valine--tRNA ligase [Rhodospirillales bacterium]